MTRAHFYIFGLVLIGVSVGLGLFALLGGFQPKPSDLQISILPGAVQETGASIQVETEEEFLEAAERGPLTYSLGCCPYSIVYRTIVDGQRYVYSRQVPRESGYSPDLVLTPNEDQLFVKYNYDLGLLLSISIVGGIGSSIFSFLGLVLWVRRRKRNSAKRAHATILNNP